VRQLESLMRLSEAMARLHCDDKIRPAYVKEVCRLLKESIIPIKKQDLELDDEQNETKNAQREINLIQGQSGVHA
jgi:DNA replication licensing factor MCM6